MVKPAADIPWGSPGASMSAPQGEAPLPSVQSGHPPCRPHPGRWSSHLSHILPSQREAGSIGLPTSEMQADFHPQAKLGLA